MREIVGIDNGIHDRLAFHGIDGIVVKPVIMGIV